jgi:hypothetical protein
MDWKLKHGEFSQNILDDVVLIFSTSMKIKSRIDSYSEIERIKILMV